MIKLAILIFCGIFIARFAALYDCECAAGFYAWLRSRFALFSAAPFSQCMKDTQHGRAQKQDKSAGAIRSPSAQNHPSRLLQPIARRRPNRRVDKPTNFVSSPFQQHGRAFYPKGNGMIKLPGRAEVHAPRAGKITRLGVQRFLLVSSLTIDKFLPHHG